jgi:hypothetical protein
MSFANKNVLNFLRTLPVWVLILLATAGISQAQLPISPSTQFDVTGFIQTATVDTPGDPHSGGTIQVNGHTITVPRETIVILPANALTWQEMFAQAPAPYGPASTGLALADVPAPMSTYQAEVVGNRVLGAAPNEYIAGLIYISQQALNNGSGFINYINYSTGELLVGGTLGSSITGTRVQLNDPKGRYGRMMTPDQRFTVDPDNPTITAATGFPMCLPRTDPAVTNDTLCPQTQRPVAIAPAVGFASIIQMNDPGALAGVPPDATIQAPFEVGDWISFAGTLVQDLNPLTPTAGPWPGTANTYIAAHTITNNVAIYTWHGTNPAYVATNVALIGTGGLQVLGVGEAVIRTRFEGMSTDPSRLVHLYGIDYNPTTGATTDRDFGTIGVDPGPPTGATKGRWRFRPPCAVFGTVPAKPDKQCVMNAAGTFLPVPRELRSVVEGSWVPGQVATYANGLVAGQYHAPITTIIFPENIPGAPIVENSFNSIPFLNAGGYSSSTGVIAGVLNPWPSATAPVSGCQAAFASAGGPYTAASGGSVTLGGSATGTAPISFAWTLPAQGSLSNASLANPVYTAPVVAAQTVVSLQLTATNCGGSSPATSTVTVSAPTSPTVNPIPAISVFSGASASIPITGSDPGGLKLNFITTQTSGIALKGLKASSTGNFTAALQFTAPILPAGSVTPSVATITVTVQNSKGVFSAPVTTTITTKPLPDSIAIATAVYRTLKQRLTVTATTNNPNATLFLQPYLTKAGTIYDPNPAAGGLGNVFTNVAGVLTLDISGAPEPVDPPATPLVVTSNVGGASPPSAVTKLVL